VGLLQVHRPPVLKRVVSRIKIVLILLYLKLQPPSSTTNQQVHHLVNHLDLDVIEREVRVKKMAAVEGREDIDLVDGVQEREEVVQEIRRGRDRDWDLVVGMKRSFVQGWFFLFRGKGQTDEQQQKKEITKL
jgi:hypothetical protein